MIVLNEKETELVIAILRAIDQELSRLYFNKNQKDISSPFDNTGTEYKNETFIVRAYNWYDEDNEKPNFEYKDLKVWWYKHLGRGDYMEKEKPLTLEFLLDMLKDCMVSLENDNNL